MVHSQFTECSAISDKVSACHVVLVVLGSHVEANVLPCITSLSYASTMELLETARVDAFCQGDIVVPAERRDSVLCVIWEGTCVEQKSGSPIPKSITAPSMRAIQEDDPRKECWCSLVRRRLDRSGRPSAGASTKRGKCA